MAGKLIVDTIDTDNSFITLNVQQSLIATMNVSGIYSNTGVKMIGANGTVSNTAITGLVTASQIANVANTQITGNIASSQIAPDQTLNGNVTISVIKVGQIQSSSGVIMANVNASGANIGFQLASSLAPAFSAYASSTFTVASSTNTKVPINTKIFDSNSNFDTTNNRFTPTVAGYYQIQGACFISPPNNTSGFILALYKNGSDYQHLMRDQYEVNFNQMPSGGTIVYLNGSSDYVELYVWQNGGSTQTFGQGTQNTTWFSGSLARSA
jgi:hypothetical protein